MIIIISLDRSQLRTQEYKHEMKRCCIGYRHGYGLSFLYPRGLLIPIPMLKPKNHDFLTHVLGAGLNRDIITYQDLSLLLPSVTKVTIT